MQKPKRKNMPSQNTASLWFAAIVGGVIVMLVIYLLIVTPLNEQAAVDQLLRDVASNSTDVTASAIEELRDRGWLSGPNGILMGADLEHANFSNIVLWHTNFNEANLEEANLQSADLSGSSFIDANLQGANFRDANLMETTLENANLQGADLTGANLIYANLQGTTLIDTIMPDGEVFRAEIDINRFTDPRHPDYFSSDAVLNEQAAENQ